MPRTNVGVPPEQKQIEQDLRSQYGGMMGLPEIAIELGVSKVTARKWLKGVPATTVVRSRRYRVRDVAKKLYESREY